MANKPMLLFQGPVKSRSGYGDHTRDLILSLIEMDKFDIKIAPTKWGDCPETGLNGSSSRSKLESRFLTSNRLDKKPDVYIMCSVPNEFHPVGKYNIGITAGIETTIADASWIEGCNKMDLIIVPSQHSRDVLIQTVYDKMDDRSKKKIGELKIEKTIEVLFEGADLDIFKQLSDNHPSIDSELKSIKEDFCFLYVGHWLDGKIGHDRKDTGMLIKTFCTAFAGSKIQPALILKTSSATFSILDRKHMYEKIQSIRDSIKDAPNIYLLHGDLTPAEMNGLYNYSKVKAHISFTKGEGFGRPLLEASISGKPVIASAWSGQLDFLHPNFTTLLPGDLKDVHRSAQWKGVINEGSKWFYVNYAIAEKVMRDVYSNFDRYQVLAEKQAKHSIDNFSLQQMHIDFTNLIAKHISLQPVPSQVKLTLPKLKKLGKSNTPTLNLPKLKKI
jgi:glycosyltransferase involved in cell wall biosynthesis